MEAQVRLFLWPKMALARCPAINVTTLVAPFEEGQRSMMCLH